MSISEKSIVQYFSFLMILWRRVGAKVIFLILGVLTISSFQILGQNQHGSDTVFSIAGSGLGMVTHDLRKKSVIGVTFYKFTGVDGRQVEIEESQILRIAYADGSEFVNENPAYPLKKFNLSLELNPKTGAIEYTGVVDFQGISKKDLYKTYKRLPIGLISFELKEMDDEGLNWRKYSGYFFVEKGGKEIVTFDLTIFFKEGKVRYVLENLLVGYYEAKTNSAGISLGHGNFGSSSTTTRSNFQILNPNANRSVKKFWIPVKLNLESAVNIVRVQGQKSVEEENW